MKKILLLLLLITGSIQAQQFGDWHVAMEEDPFEEDPFHQTYTKGTVIKYGDNEWDEYSSSNNLKEIFYINIGFSAGKYYIRLTNVFKYKYNSKIEEVSNVQFKIDNNPTIYTTGMRPKKNDYLTFVETLFSSDEDDQLVLAKIIAQIQKGNVLYVKIPLLDDKELLYSFSLKGSTAATNKIFGINKKPVNKGFIKFKNAVNDLNPFDLMSYYDTFVKDMHHFGVYKAHGRVNIKFGQLEGDILAVAYSFGNDNAVNITVDPENWESASAAKRVYIMYHELVHDIYNIDHTSSGLMKASVGNVSYNKLAVDLATFFKSIQ